MSVTATSSSTATSTSLSSAIQGTGALDENAFMQLLITQMQNQDPLQPTDNQQFIAQLAQFSTLEQTTQQTAQITSLGQIMGTTQALGLVGRHVQYTDSTGASTSGQVTGLTFSNGSVQLQVNGVNVSPANITGVSS